MSGLSVRHDANKNAQSVDPSNDEFNLINPKLYKDSLEEVINITLICCILKSH